MSSAGLPTTPDPVPSVRGLINAPPGTANAPQDNATGFTPVGAVPPNNTVAPSTPVPNAPSATTTTPSGVPTLAAPQTYGYNPEAYKVTEDQTVAGQIRNIIAEGSPLMQMATTNAKNLMNQRGLINSSQAITADQAALYAAATPIATSDAATYAKAAENTTNARNLAMHDTAAAQNAAGIAKLQSDTTLTAQDMQDTTSMILKNMDVEAQKWLGTLQANTQLSIADKSTEAQKLIAQWNNTSAQVIAGINANTSLTMNERDNAVKTYIANQDTATKIKLQEMATAGDLAKIRENGLVNERLQGLEDKARQILSTSSGAQTMWSNVISDIAKVMSDPNLSADQKAKISDQMMVGLNTALDAFSTIAGVNLGDTLDFGSRTAGAAATNPNSPGGGGAATPAGQTGGNNAGSYSGSGNGTGAQNNGYSAGYNPGAPNANANGVVPPPQGFNAPASVWGYSMDESGNITT